MGAIVARAADEASGAGDVGPVRRLLVPRAVGRYDVVMGKRIRVTATAAARGFSRLLDQATLGTEVLIERHAEPVALLSPVGPAPRRLSECTAVRIARPSAAPDARFAADLAEIIRTAQPTARPERA